MKKGGNCQIVEEANLASHKSENVKISEPWKLIKQWNIIVTAMPIILDNRGTVLKILNLRLNELETQETFETAQTISNLGSVLRKN